MERVVWVAGKNKSLRHSYSGGKDTRDKGGEGRGALEIDRGKGGEKGTRAEFTKWGAQADRGDNEAGCEGSDVFGGVGAAKKAALGPKNRDFFNFVVGGV